MALATSSLPVPDSPSRSVVALLGDVERVFADQVRHAEMGDLPLDRPYREAREAFERAYFENLLSAESGSMSRVAERSGLERTHLYRKLKALGLPVGRREEG